MLLVFLTLALVSVQPIVGDEVCRVRGDLTTNGLKCADKIYPRNSRLVDAMRTCTVGKKGQPITTEIAGCVLSNYKTADGSGSYDDVMHDLSGDFGAHAEQMSAGSRSCYSQFKDEPSSVSTKLMECLNALYEKVCGYKTCNWLNNIL